LPTAELDPYLDSLLADDPGLIPADQLAPPASAPMQAARTMPPIPNFGGAGMPGWQIPGGFPQSGFVQPELQPEREKERSALRLDDATPEPLEHGRVLDDEDDDRTDDDAPAQSPATPGSAPPAAPTAVTLPDGETVTAASPQLAAAIKAAVTGTPITDAFRQQGITLPPPGTAVADPVEPSRLAPGDIGMFTNRHALALGDSKALLDGQIQPIPTVKGPSFLGWEHPPAPGTATPPKITEAPVPTRPAAAGSRE
jgi:hypothetical protein